MAFQRSLSFHPPIGFEPAVWASASVHVISLYDSIVPNKMEHGICRELGNTIGLLDYILAGRAQQDPDNWGCMTGGKDLPNDAWQRPARQDIDALNRAYAHLEGP